MATHQGGKINLNNATLSEIADIPMVGKDKAENIVSHRPYKNWDDLKRVPGVSEGLIDELRNNATI